MCIYAENEYSKKKKFHRHKKGQIKKELGHLQNETDCQCHKVDRQNGDVIMSKNLEQKKKKIMMILVKLYYITKRFT